MYNLEVTYIDGKTDKFRCKDYYYDEMGDVVIIELNNTNNMYIMMNKIRKMDVTNIDE